MTCDATQTGPWWDFIRAHWPLDERLRLARLTACPRCGRDPKT